MNEDVLGQQKKLISVVFICLIALCCCFVIFAVTAKFTEPPPITSTPWQLPTQPATNTPQQTVTPQLSMNTPLPINTVSPPTNTPLPTDAPTPVWTEEEAAYLQWTSEIITQYSDAFFRFGELNSAASEDVTLILSEDWIIDIVLALVNMRLLNEEILIQAVDTPEQFFNFHQQLLNATYYYDIFVTLYLEGLDDTDANKLIQATDAMILGNESMNKATDVMNEIMGTDVEFNAIIPLPIQPTDTPQSTTTSQPTNTPRPTTSSAVAVCSCSSNSLNCSDFSTHSQAQACFDYCIDQGAGDIHDLDRDNDNSVCED